MFYSTQKGPEVSETTSVEECPNFNEPEVTGLLNQPGTPKLPIKLAKMVESTSFGDGQTAVNQR